MASNDCVVDTHILSEIISQYNALYQFNQLYQTPVLSNNLVSTLNRLILKEGNYGKIIASTFAFVEILNKFHVISLGKFSASKLYGFLQQPPDWFEIEALSLDSLKNYVNIPKYTSIMEGIELADSFHIATAYQRGPCTKLATLDLKIRKTDFPLINIIW